MMQRLLLPPLRPQARRILSQFHRPLSTQLNPDTLEIYEGTFSKAMQILKRVSVFSCGCTTIGVPLLALVGNDALPVVQKVAVSGTVVSFAFLTTAALHYFAKPYVVNMYYEEGEMYDGKEKVREDAEVAFETMTLFGSKILHKVQMKDIEPLSGRVWANFTIKDSEMPFYVHDETLAEDADAEAGPWFDLEFRKQFLERIKQDEEA